MGEGEDDVEISHGQEFRLAGFKPARFGQRLALGAMPITAGVVSGSFETALVALLEMAAKGGSAAAFDGAHDLELQSRQRMGVAESLAVEAEDIRHFPSRPFKTRRFCRPMAMGRGHERFLLKPLGVRNHQQIQRALGRPQLLARDLEVAHGREDTAMPHEDLDGTRVDAGLQQVRGEGVAKRMDAAVFVDFGPLFGLRESKGGRGSAKGEIGILPREQPQRRMILPPVVPQIFEKARREEGIAVFVPLALFDADHHAVGVDVGDFEVDEFADPKPTAVGGLEKHAVFEVAGGGEQTNDLLGAENPRQPLRRFARRDGQEQGLPHQGDAIEELQPRGPGVDRAPREPALAPPPMWNS